MKLGENKAKDVETPAKRAKLEQELGRLTFEMAELREEQNKRAKRSNEIGGLLKGLNG
ncbi:hypothetical protein LCGC14_0553550 [marine sediment metagenome]|uniref:Uncharacterized protein n=1 Tax=marine sediment metagenome TaxID=412755 RepID=A0A0F9RP43_9ZZZZ